MRVPITNQFQVVMYLQAAINICLSCIDICLSCLDVCFQIVLTFVSSCYLQVVTSTRCLCVAICLQDVTRVYKLLQCTSSSCITTFGNDVAARSEMTYHHVRK